MKKVFLTIALVAPALAFGQNVDGLIATVGGWVAALTPIAFALAVLFFFYGLAMFILKEGEGQDAGKSIMIWGVVAIFVMASVFGLVNFLQDTLNLSNEETINVPSVNGIGGGAVSDDTN